MDAVDDYLRLPAAYAEPFRGWRWSAGGGEAVEDGSGKSVVLAAELAAFVEGFALQGPLVHFGHTVHLLFLLRRFALDPRRQRLAALQRLFRDTRRRTRNAGAFCAVLCRHL